MIKRYIRYDFDSDVPMREVEGTLRLAQLATESLVGVDRMQLEAKFNHDAASHTVTIDTTGKVGRTLALIFGGYARREFGAAVVATHVVDDVQQPAVAGAGA